MQRMTKGRWLGERADNLKSHEMLIFPGGFGRMGLKCVVLALALIGSLAATASALGPKNQIVEPRFPGDEMSGSEIYSEVREGAHDGLVDGNLSFRNESLFVIRKDTGMSPHVPDQGVRTPVKVILGLGTAPAAGSWSFTLSDTATRYLGLDLFQTGDAVSGYGELRDRGTSVMVTAGGTVLGDRLALFVTPVGGASLYRFSLDIKPGSMSGDYIFTAPGVTQPGVAFASLIAPGWAAPAGLQTAWKAPAFAQPA